MLKDFSGALVGVALVKVADYLIAPEGFDLAEEALETVVIAAVITVLFSLFKRWRRRRKRSS